MSAVMLPRRASWPGERMVAACTLAMVALLVAAACFSPESLVLHPLQRSVLFKQVSGYTLVALLAFALSFGWLRRRGEWIAHPARLKELHQLTGLCFLVVLSAHLGQAPSGFLLASFYVIAIATGAGALRTLMGNRLGAATSKALLGLHIGISCLIPAGALVHVWLVYVYGAR